MLRMILIKLSITRLIYCSTKNAHKEINMNTKEATTTQENVKRSSLEVGKLWPGTTKLKFSQSGSYEGWSYGEPNAANGIGVMHEIYNASERSMKYITVTYIAFNRVGDIVSCKTTGRCEANGRLTGPVEPDEKTNLQWDVLWYNPTVDTVQIKEIVIEYMDGDTETIAASDIVYMEDENSVYYEKHGKQEELQNKNSKLKSAYMGPLVLAFLKDAKEDEELKFHVNQGLWLFIIEVLGLIVSFIPYVGVFLMFIFIAAGIVFSVLCSKAIDKGEKKEIPLIGKIKLIK